MAILFIERGVNILLRNLRKLQINGRNSIALKKKEAVINKHDYWRLLMQCNNKYKIYKQMAYNTRFWENNTYYILELNVYLYHVIISWIIVIDKLITFKNQKTRQFFICLPTFFAVYFIRFPYLKGINRTLIKTSALKVT